MCKKSISKSSECQKLYKFKGHENSLVLNILLVVGRKVKKFQTKIIENEIINQKKIFLWLFHVRVIVLALWLPQSLFSFKEIWFFH